ncbi:AAA family ATPase [Sulfitobacter mediterraneus]|uniref:5-methylcytosine-specific restriction protein B n=1 Tax=Sulfitobacter mediterraneus TaxID=83219 RepID=A0A2T6C535_9RHOB|nr:AAA family ATPase [Sulfitobacter mediterraneus]KIN78166.1 McrBC restriction endonuclease system, McrB subunit [Sulfitobacter mediterraneus KCTC 32188]PTX63393.1 5-methylcytosine-specific restriction protein B [Sulfitobacter mediterraneus]
MWSDIEKRVSENEADTEQSPAPHRKAIFAKLKNAPVIPVHAVKKMAFFKLEDDEAFLWELTRPALNFFVHSKHTEAMKEAGFFPEPRPYDPSKPPSGGRHVALSQKQSFEKDDCLCIKVTGPEDIDRLISVISETEGFAQGRVLSRAQIEAAMDAYDSFRNKGAHSENFGVFGEPRDYWVRSSRDRENRAYPTKPLIGFILGKTKLNGGWGQKADAAARLHNAGFIIVDQKDRPIDRPERYEHLIEGASRIRLCALNYFIEPAREKAAREVSIRAGDLAAAMGLKDAFPNICQALGGEKFQNLAQVPPPTSTEPNPSSSTVFTYTLNSQPEADTVTDTNNAASPSAVNLILYGPPGTGKTYQTAWEAVRLCIGDEAAAELKDDRDQLTAEYRRLANEGRIEFLTFHQSLSYEEFVEGLRPSTGDDDLEGPDETAGGTGFQLKCHEGIFKRISERARLDQGESGGTQRLDRSARVFKVALGRRHVEDERIRFGLDNDLIHLGWGEDIDWSDERFDEFNEIFAEWRSKKNPDASGHDGNIVCTFSFRADMQVGDYVVVSDGRDRIQALGRVAGEYYFDPDATYHPHRRKMEWLWRSEEGTDRSKFYPNGFRRHSVYKLNQSLIDWDALEEISFGEDTSLQGKEGRDYVLIIDEINRANISKVFGELITLLEQDKRLGAQNEVRVQLPYSKKRFGVPPNLHIVGTMNTADRSIALLDTALRRRFMFQELMPDPTVLSEDVGGINLRALLSTINERIEYLFDREHQIGHAYFTSCHSRADVEDVMRHKVIPLLAEYFYEDWAKVAAVLGDGPGMAKEHFLESAGLKPPKGMPEDDINGDKLRWNVKADFDFSEFEA